MRLFLSAHRPEFTSHANDLRNEALKQDLLSLGVRSIREVKGCYKGVKEDSLEVARGDAELKDVLALAGKYQQESLLMVTMSNIAYLVYPNGNVMEEIGVFFKVAGIPLNCDYSMIDDEYYIIRRDLK
jgi:hypothetical protein